MQQLAAPVTRRGEASHICNEAYQHTQTDILFEPIKEKVLAIGIIAGALLIVTLIAYVWIYFDARGQIKGMLDKIASAQTSNP